MEYITNVILIIDIIKTILIELHTRVDFRYAVRQAPSVGSGRQRSQSIHCY